MKIDISNKVPFSSLAPGDRGTIGGKPFMRIMSLVDASCDGTINAVSLETGAPLCVSLDTLVEVEDRKAREDREPKRGEVWIDEDGDCLLRTDSDMVPWIDLATGRSYGLEVDTLVAPVDVKLVRA